MATLEKIRSKSVLLVIVIGVALLAFIVGDAITNSQNLFGDRTTVAKIGGTKIDHTEYEAKLKELQDAYGQQYDAQMLQQLAIEQVAQEKLLNEAVKKMGIEVSGEMLREVIFNQGSQNQDVQNLLRALNQRGIAVSTPEEAYSKIFNPERSGLKAEDMKGFQEAWIAIEKDAKQNLERYIYMQLWSGTINANKLDKKALYDEMMATQEVKYARAPYGDLEDPKYKPSEDDLKAQYEEVKARYAVNQPTKRVAVIAVNVAPGDEDLKASKNLAALTFKALGDSVVSLPKDATKAGVSLVSTKNVEKNIPVQVRNVLKADTIGTGSVTEIANNISGFKLVKKGAVTMELDSIEMNIIGVASPKLADKVLAALNGGLAVDSLSTKFSTDSVQGQTQWLVRYAQDRPVIEFSDTTMSMIKNPAKPFFKLSDNDVATIFGMQPQGGVIIMRANEVKPAKPVYSYDYAEYTLLPSSATQDQKVAELQQYINANQSVKAFKENASNAGYVVTEYNIVPSMPGLPMMGNAGMFRPESASEYGQIYDNTMSLVGWAVKHGEAGKVRQSVYENGNNTAPVIFAMAVESEFKDYAPLELVKDEVTTEASRKKAGEEMTKKYAAMKNVDEVAKAMGVVAQTNPNMSMNSMRGEPKVLGMIAGTKEKSPMVVVAGNNGVYAYEVVAKGANPVQEYNDDMMDSRWIDIVLPGVQRNGNVASQFLGRALRGTKKYDNRLFDFILVEE